MPRAPRHGSSSSIPSSPLSDGLAGSSATQAFQEEVLRQIQRIPAGRVTSYGHIAKLAGRPRNSRLVGQTLKLLPRTRSAPSLLATDGSGGMVDNPNFVPWHRVVNSKGVISPRGSAAAVLRQATLLREEGVTVTTGVDDAEEPHANNGNVNPDAFGLAGVEGGRISLRQFGWFPDA